MKQLWAVLAIGVLALYAVAAANPAGAMMHCTESGQPGHSEYGRGHVAHHAHMGMFNGMHNPGMHRGYSTCMH